MKNQKLMEDELIVARWPGSWTRKVGGIQKCKWPVLETVPGA